jgi:hypothetical protein
MEPTNFFTGRTTRQGSSPNYDTFSVFNGPRAIVVT